MKSSTTSSSKRIAIILPNRVGDAVLSLPLLRCLRNLVNEFGPTGTVVEAVTFAPLLEVFAAVGVSGVTEMGFGAKLKSWLRPPDVAFFLIATSKNVGYHARSTYGLRQQNKQLTRYDHDLPCLRGEPLPAALEQYLTMECNLPRYSVQQFGVVLKLGYSVEQIISSFSFSRQSLALDRSRLSAERPVQAPYLVYCLEAAYGRGRRNDNRRWVAEHHLELARQLSERYDCPIVFIGLAAVPTIPVHDRFLDLRGKLSLWHLFQVMAGANGYVGNDTGPLHLANLAGIPSTGIYSSEDHHAPLFGELNTVVMRPGGPEYVYPEVQRMIHSTALGTQR